MSSPRGLTSGDDLAFARRRVGLVASVILAIIVVALVGAVLQATVGGLANRLFDASFFYTLGAAGCYAALAAACFSLPLGRRALVWGEAACYLVGAIFIMLGSFEVGLDVRPELMAITGLTYVLALRAALVPVTAQNTFWLCTVIGVPVVTATWFKYSADPVFVAVSPEIRAPGLTTFWATIWWIWTTGVCTVISRVVHGLRREVRAAERLGQYTLDEPLGSGGMGEVWRGTHRLLRRPAAIKLIRADALGAAGAGAAAVQARFEREAQTVATLQSAHTVELYDFGISDDGVFYHVMEMLVGWDLEALVRQHGPLPAERVVYLLDQVCDSLDDAHDAGLVHRDIKPANIFVTRRGRRHDFVKVLDFGLAKAVETSAGDASLTRDGTVPGTPAFLPPEAVSGPQAVDARSDLYAVGCVAYWLLTGAYVFDGATPMAIVAAHLSEAPLPPSSRTELPIPAGLDHLVLSCLAKDPADRPQSATDLAQALHACDLAEPWSADRARDWWALHRPTPPAAAPDPAMETRRVLHPRFRS